MDFEQSTAYHRLVLEAFFTSYALLRRHGEPVPDECWSRLERMCEFVAGLYQAGWPRAAHRRRRRRPHAETRGRRTSTTIGICCRAPPSAFRPDDFKSSADRCWEETFWLFGADAPDALRGAAGPVTGTIVHGVSRRRVLRAARSATRTSSSTAARSA